MCALVCTKRSHSGYSLNEISSCRVCTVLSRVKLSHTHNIMQSIKGHDKQILPSLLCCWWYNFNHHKVFVTLFFYKMSEAQHAHISYYKRGWRDRRWGLLAYKWWFNVFSNWKEIIISLKCLQNHTLIHACMYSQILAREKEHKKWIKTHSVYS